MTTRVIKSHLGSLEQILYANSFDLIVSSCESLRLTISDEIFVNLIVFFVQI